MVYVQASRSHALPFSRMENTLLYRNTIFVLHLDLALTAAVWSANPNLAPLLGRAVMLGEISVERLFLDRKYVFSLFSLSLCSGVPYYD